MNSSSEYCFYYQGNIQRELCWYVTAALRSYDHMAFDRTLDPATSLFEFFVAPSMENQFLTVCAYFEQQGLLRNLVKLPNRLENLDEQV